MPEHPSLRLRVGGRVVLGMKGGVADWVWDEHPSNMLPYTRQPLITLICRARVPAPKYGFVHAIFGSIPHSWLQRPKITRQFWWQISCKSIFWWIFERNIFIRIQIWVCSCLLRIPHSYFGSSGQKSPDNFDDKSLTKANFQEYLKEKSSSEFYLQLSFKISVNLSIISDLLPKVSKMQTTIMWILRHELDYGLLSHLAVFFQRKRRYFLQPHYRRFLVIWILFNDSNFYGFRGAHSFWKYLQDLKLGFFSREPSCIIKFRPKVLCMETNTALGSLQIFEGAEGPQVVLQGQ